MIKILVAFVTGSAGLVVTLHPAPSNAASSFTYSASGGFVDPNGQQWPTRRLNAGVQDAVQGVPNVMTYYPGMRSDDRSDAGPCGTMWDHSAATMADFYTASNTATGYEITVAGKVVVLFPDGVPGNDITAVLTVP
jgi:hypothetical protein